MSRSIGSFTDTASGKTTPRPKLERARPFAREGDTVVVHSMDRLARNWQQNKQIEQGDFRPLPPLN